MKTRKGVTAIIAILVLTLVSASITGAAWLSLQSAFFSENTNEFDVISDSVHCTDGVIYAEITNIDETMLANGNFISVEIRTTDNNYKSTCHSECLKLNAPLEDEESTLLFEWDCPDRSLQIGCSGSYIVSFIGKYRVIEELINC